jgi:GAF domain-containing protein
MAESLSIQPNLTRSEQYEQLLPQLKALLGNETDLIANLANLAAALRQTFGFFWVGFYLKKEGELVLGPFQGPIACSRIAIGKGVCGTSFEKMQTIIVEDVNSFPGHIACSADSKSEIVVPFDFGGEKCGVLDIDSNQLADFDKNDQLYLEKIVKLLQ